MKVYSLFDRALREFGGLVVMNNDESVIRAALDSLEQARGKGPMGKYPADFDLMCLASFDVETGEFTPERSRLVVNLGSLLPIVKESHHASDSQAD